MKKIINTTIALFLIVCIAYIGYIKTKYQHLQVRYEAERLRCSKELLWLDMDLSTRKDFYRIAVRDLRKAELTNDLLERDMRKLVGCKSSTYQDYSPFLFNRPGVSKTIVVQDSATTIADAVFKAYNHAQDSLISLCNIVRNEAIARYTLQVDSVDSAYIHTEPYWDRFIKSTYYDVWKDTRHNCYWAMEVQYLDWNGFVDNCVTNIVEIEQIMASLIDRLNKQSELDKLEEHSEDWLYFEGDPDFLRLDADLFQETLKTAIAEHRF